MSLTCLILAGGLGSRMSPYTKTMPKILIPVGERPFLHHQLTLLEKQGFTRVILSLGYLGTMVVDELERQPHPSLEIEFVFDGSEPLGTGGATRQACENYNLGDHFFVTYGDSYLLINPKNLIDAFNSEGYDAMMTLYDNKEDLDVSNASISPDGSVTYKKNLSNPKAHGLNMIDFGLSYLSVDSVLRLIPSDRPSDLAEYFEKLSKSRRLQGYLSVQRFFEIGSPSGRDALEQFLNSTKGQS